MKELWQKWPQSEELTKSKDQIKVMIRKKAFQTFFKVRTKLIVECLALLALMFIAYTALDPQLNSTQVNLLLIGVLVLGIVNNVILALTTNIKLRGGDIKHSLERVVADFRRQRTFSTIYAVIYFTSVFVFLLARVELTFFKALLAGVLLIWTIGIRIWFERKQWSKRILQINSLLEEFKRA